MRNKVLIFVLSGAVISGLIAAVSVSRYLADLRGAGNLNNVVVAKSEIRAGEKIVAEQLTTVRLPRSAMPDGAYDSHEKVVGRVATERIAQRELVTRLKLAPEGAAAGLPALIPEGYRAMTVKVDDEVEIAGFLAPGRLVDVLAVINPPDGGSSQNPVSKIILQNIKVLAGGQKPDQPRSGRESAGAKSVTLLVTPEQAEKLVLSSVDGKLKLALRNSVDQGDERTPGANKTTLLGGVRPLPGLATSSADIRAAGPPRDGGRDGAPRPPRIRARPVMASVAEPATAAAPATEPAPARPPIEVYEGVKKKAVVFP